MRRPRLHPASRRTLRGSLAAGLAASLAVSAMTAWVGVVVVAATHSRPAAPAQAADRGATSKPPTAAFLAAHHRYLVGAAKTSMQPRPEDYAARFPGARWETDPAKCKTLDPAFLNALPDSATNSLDGIASTGSPWPENPDCIYMGGFGIGPMNPVASFDQTLGLWVRSLAISDGTDTAIFTVVDAEGWLWDYKSKCTDCGAKQIAASLAADPDLAARGVTADSFVLHATHSHSGPDFIGGWGFVPDWYMAQITDEIKATSKAAVMAMEQTTLETGEIEARQFNSERRDTYRSAEEQQLSYLRAISVPHKDAAGHPVPAHTVATLGAYAAHPTTRGTNNGVASSDWVGVFEKRVEDRFGGIALHIMTGLGNMSASGGTDAVGNGLANLLPDPGKGRKVSETDLVIAHDTVRSAITNVPLDALGTPGFFDRKFDAQPVAVRTGEVPDTAPCLSASPQSVELPVTAMRLGRDVVMTTGPGELFSNGTNSIKEKSTDRVVMPFAQTNDSLGYMPQEFEINPVGQQGLGFAFGGYLFVNYEDSYAIDKCVGDLVVENTLDLVRSLG